MNNEKENNNNNFEMSVIIINSKERKRQVMNREYKYRLPYLYIFSLLINKSIRLEISFKIIIIIARTRRISQNVNI